jgi:hypothetical protein
MRRYSVQRDGLVLSHLPAQSRPAYRKLDRRASGWARRIAANIAKLPELLLRSRETQETVRRHRAVSGKGTEVAAPSK